MRPQRLRHLETMGRTTPDGLVTHLEQPLPRYIMPNVCVCVCVRHCVVCVCVCVRTAVVAMCCFFTHGSCYPGVQIFHCPL